MQQYICYLYFQNYSYPLLLYQIYKLMTLFLLSILPNPINLNQYSQTSLLSSTGQPLPPQLFGQQIDYFTYAPLPFSQRGQMNSQFLVNGLSYYTTLLLIYPLGVLFSCCV